MVRKKYNPEEIDEDFLNFNHPERETGISTQGGERLSQKARGKEERDCF